MSTIKPFPELVAYAEAEARARVVRFAEMEGEPCAPDGDVSTVARIELSLLCDLTHDASYDAVARLVAVRIGVRASAVHQAVEDASGEAWRHLPASLRGEIGTTFDNTACLAAIVDHLWPRAS